jgi:hypothetical protein
MKKVANAINMLLEDDTKLILGELFQIAFNPGVL